MKKSKALEETKELRTEICKALEVKQGISVPPPPWFLITLDMVLRLLYIIELAIIENRE